MSVEEKQHILYEFQESINLAEKYLTEYEKAQAYYSVKVSIDQLIDSYMDAEDEDEKEVKQDVGDRRGEQVIEGMARVADGAQDPCAHIVDEKPRKPRKVDDEVFLGEGEDLTVAAVEHQAQNGGGEGDADHGEEDGEDERHHDRGVDGALDLILLLRAVVARDDNARAAGQPRENADHTVDDRADVTDGGVRGVLARLADDPGIDHVVKLLEEVTDKERQGKENEIPHDRAARHIHIVPPSAKKAAKCRRHTIPSSK